MLLDLLGMESCMFHWPVGKAAAHAIEQQPELHLGNLGGALLAVAAVVLLASLVQAIRQLLESQRKAEQQPTRRVP